MKHGFLKSVCIFCLFIFSCQPVKKSNSTNSDFKKSSGVTSIQLSDQKIEDLALLGKVWGFLKYYHPVVATGKYNWDFELFKILPQIIACKNEKERNEILLSWIDTLGTFEKGKRLKIDSAKVKCYPDLDWIKDTGKLGDSLSNKLIEIKDAKRTGENYYVSFTGSAGNPIFTNEDSCVQFKYPDAGYRLLCLYRYWNMIQYFYPDKYLIGEDWKNVLTEYIPKFINASNELEYKLTVSAVIASIHDSHGMMFCRDSVWVNYLGKRSALVRVSFIGENAVVTDFLTKDAEENCGLKKGDVILKIGNKTTNDLLKEKLPLAHASNKPTALRNLSTILLCSNDSSLNITYQRGKDVRSLDLKCYLMDSLKNVMKNFSKRDTCLKFLTPEISYIYPGTIKNEYFQNVLTGFSKTKGMIIDFRCYPSDMFIFPLCEFLLPTPTPFVKFTIGSNSTPGLFEFNGQESVGKDNPFHYRGKVVIIVNETTQSSAEFQTMALQCAPNATVIGSTTAGADGNVSPIDLIGGISTMISGIGIYYPDGRETQRVGIVPDIEVHPTIEGIREGRDELLEKAIQIINGK